MFLYVILTLFKGITIYYSALSKLFCWDQTTFGVKFDLHQKLMFVYKTVLVKKNDTYNIRGGKQVLSFTHRSDKTEFKVRLHCVHTLNNREVITNQTHLS